MIYLPTQEHGQGLVEFALILVLIAIVVLIILTTVGGTLTSAYSQIYTSVDSAISGSI